MECTEMTIRLKPETERLVQEELQNGRFRSVDEMIVQGVQARRDAKPLSRDARRKTPAEAVAHIRQLRRGNFIPDGVTIKDLINEGRA
jgi:Arc/MetJ-type ribon-helix-helix transcriptional regulator